MRQSARTDSKLGLERIPGLLGRSEELRFEKGRTALSATRGLGGSRQTEVKRECEACGKAQIERLAGTSRSPHIGQQREVLEPFSSVWVPSTPSATLSRSCSTGSRLNCRTPALMEAVRVTAHAKHANRADINKTSRCRRRYVNSSRML